MFYGLLLNNKKNILCNQIQHQTIKTIITISYEKYLLAYTFCKF